MRNSNYGKQVAQTVLQKQTGQSMVNFKSIKSDSVQNMRSRINKNVSTKINGSTFNLKTKKSMSTVPEVMMCLTIIDDQLVSGFHSAKQVNS